MAVGVEFQGYQCLLGPEQIMLSPTERVSSPAEYFVWHEAVVTARHGRPWDSEEKVKAYVNHGKWVANCHWCKLGMLTRPSWGVAYCGECGARYGVGMVDFPKNHASIEAVLVRRLRRDQQHWDDRQGVRELVEENELPEVMTA